MCWHQRVAAYRRNRALTFFNKCRPLHLECIGFDHRWTNLFRSSKSIASLSIIACLLMFVLIEFGLEWVQQEEAGRCVTQPTKTFAYHSVYFLVILTAFRFESQRIFFHLRRMESTATVQIAVTARLRTSLRLITTPDELLGLLGITVLLLLLLSQLLALGTPTQVRCLGFLRALGSPHPLNISFWCATLEATTAGFSCQVWVWFLSPFLELLSFCICT